MTLMLNSGRAGSGGGGREGGVGLLTLLNLSYKIKHNTKSRANFGYNATFSGTTLKISSEKCVTSFISR